MISKDTLPGTKVVVDGYAAIVVEVCGLWVLCALVGQDGGDDSGFCYATPSCADACKKLGFDPEARYYYCPYLNSDSIRLAKEETMKSADIKVEVGQIWSCNSVGRYKITSIQGTMAYGKNLRNPDSKEIVFGGLTSDGKPLYWAGDWELEEPTKPVEVPKPVIVKVGQVWSSSYASYRITKIYGKAAYGENSDPSSLAREVVFGYLTADGKPEWNTDAWKLKEETMTSNATEDKPIDQVQANPAPKLRPLTKDDKPGTKIMVDGNRATLICRDTGSGSYVYYRYDEHNVEQLILTYDAKSTYAVAAKALGFDHKERRYSGRNESHISVIEEEPKSKRYIDKDTKPGTKVLFNGKVMTYVCAQQMITGVALLHWDDGGSDISAEWAKEAAKALGFNPRMPQYHAASYHQCEIIEGAEPVKLVAEEPAKQTNKLATPDTKPGARVRIYGREGVLVCNHKHSPGNALVYMDNGNGRYTIRSAWAHNAAKALRLKPYARRYDDYPYYAIEIIEEAKEEVKPKEEPAAPLKEEPVVAAKKFATKDTKPGTKVMIDTRKATFICMENDGMAGLAFIRYDDCKGMPLSVNHNNYAYKAGVALGFDPYNTEYGYSNISQMTILEEPTVQEKAKRYIDKDTKPGTRVLYKGRKATYVCQYARVAYIRYDDPFAPGVLVGAIDNSDLLAVAATKALGFDPNERIYAAPDFHHCEILDEPIWTPKTVVAPKQYSNKDTKPGTKVMYKGKLATFIGLHPTKGYATVHIDGALDDRFYGSVGGMKDFAKTAKGLGLDPYAYRYLTLELGEIEVVAVSSTPLKETEAVPEQPAVEEKPVAYCDITLSTVKEPSSPQSVEEKPKPKSTLGLLVAGMLFGGALASVKRNETSARISSSTDEEEGELQEENDTNQEALGSE